MFLWAQEESGPERSKGRQASPRGPGRLSWLTVSRAQGKNSAPTAARLCGLDRAAHQPGVAGPRCEAGGGRREAGEAAPPPASSHRRSGRRPANPPVLRAAGTGWDETPASPCPGRRRRPCPGEGDGGPGGQDPAGMRSRAGGWGRGGKAEKNPTESRHTGLDSSGWTRRTRPRPPDKPARVQATAAQGWARSPASERDPSKMPVGTAPDSKGGAGTHSNSPPGPTLPGSSRPHGWRVTPPDPLPCCRGPSNPHSNPRRQVPISGIHVP